MSRMKNRFELKFDKIMTGLAGYDFGEETYNDQVKEKIDFSDKIIIVLPDNIQRIATSFIQGFFSEIKSKIGISGIEKNVEIQSSIDNIKTIVIKNLL